MSDPEHQMVDPKDLQPGPIRHDTLRAELLEHIRAVYDVIGPYFDTTLEQFESGFMRRMTKKASWWELWSPSRLA